MNIEATVDKVALDAPNLLSPAVCIFERSALPITFILREILGSFVITNAKEMLHL